MEWFEWAAMAAGLMVLFVVWDLVFCGAGAAEV
jgi:hypothetical protein